MWWEVYCSSRLVQLWLGGCLCICCRGMCHLLVPVVCKTKSHQCTIWRSKMVLWSKQYLEVTLHLKILIVWSIDTWNKEQIMILLTIGWKIYGMILSNCHTHFQLWTVYPIEDFKWPILVTIGVDGPTSTISQRYCENMCDPNLLWPYEIKGVAKVWTPSNFWISQYCSLVRKIA